MPKGVSAAQQELRGGRREAARSRCCAAGADRVAG